MAIYTKMTKAISKEEKLVMLKEYREFENTGILKDGELKGLAQRASALMAGYTSIVIVAEHLAFEMALSIALDEK